MDEASSQDEYNRLLAEAIIDTVREPLVVLTRDLRVERANAAFYRTFHVSPEDTEGRLLYNVGNGQWDISLLCTLLEEILPEKKVVTDFAVAHDFPELGPRVMLLNAREVVRREAGDTRILLAIDDITERRQCEHVLHESEERYRAFSEATTEGLVLHEHGRIIEVNQTIADHLGYAPEEMIGHHVMEFVAPESREFMAEQMRHHASGPYEAYSLHRDGSRTVGEIEAREIFYRGRMVRVVAIREITARKRAEDALRKSEARLRAAISSIADEIWFTDEQGKILMVNRAVYTNLGLDPDTAFFADIEEAVAGLEIYEPDGTPRPPEQAFLTRALRGEVLCSVGELVRNVATGELRYREVSVSPIRDGQEHIIGAVGVVRDVTERKRAEAERERLLDEVRTRAAELDATLDGIADGVVIYGENECILRMNDAAQRLLGFTEEECIHSAFARWRERGVETVDGTPFPVEKIPALCALRGETVTGIEVVLHQPDGRVVWLAASAAPIFVQARLIGVVSVFTDITRQHELQMQLRHLLNEVRTRVAELDATIDGVADGFVVYDPDGHIIRMNAPAREMLGFTDAECHETMLSRWAPRHVRTPEGEPLPLEQFPVCRALRGERVQGVVLVVDCPPSGRTVWLSASAGPFHSPDGRILGAVANYADITPIIKLRRELEHRIAELDATITAVADGLIIYNADGEILLDNPAARQLLDGTLLDAEYSMHPHWLSLAAFLPDGTPLRPDDAPGARAARGETVSGETLLFKRHDGTVIWASVAAAPILGRDGVLQGIVSTYTDITPIVMLRQEVEAKAAEVEATFAALADAIVIYTPDGEVRYHNQRARELLDNILSEDEKPRPPQWMAAFARRPDGAPISPEDSPAARAARGEVVTGEMLVFHCPDGEEIWVSATAAPICMHGGMLMGVAGTYTDITALHRLQEQQKMLLQTVSHDLRAPLAVIKGHAQVVEAMLSERQLDGELKESVAAIIRGASRMDVMIQDLVDVARWEGGQLTLRREAVAVPSFLQELLRRNSPAIETARVTVEVPADLPPVWADYARLERILVNLLSNALKYSDPGTPVSVRVRHAENEVVFAVTDQGRGIPPEALPHLFERFFRAETTRATEGVGLGLYITRALVEAHGGRVWVESVVGVGSTFYVALPTVE